MSLNQKHFLSRIQEIETSASNTKPYNLKPNFSPKRFLRRNFTLSTNKDLKADKTSEKDINFNGLDPSIYNHGTATVKLKSLNSSLNDVNNFERETSRNSAAFGDYFKNRPEKEHKAKFRYSNNDVESPQNYFKKTQFNTDTFETNITDSSKPSKVIKTESLNASDARRFFSDKRFILPKINK